MSLVPDYDSLSEDEGTQPVASPQNSSVPSKLPAKAVVKTTKDGKSVVQLELPVASFKLSGDTSDVEQIAQGAKRKSGGRTYQRDSISCILPPPKHSSSSKTRYHGASSQPTKRQKTIENEKELLSVESHTNDTESDAAHFASRSAATHYPLTPSESQVNHDTAPSSTSDNVSQLGVNTHPSLDLPVEFAGRKRRGQAPIEIKEISAAEVYAPLPAGYYAEYQQQEMARKLSSTENDFLYQPSNVDRAKHQITQLAFDVRATDHQFLEAKAANIRTKREVNARYGW